MGSRMRAFLRGMVPAFVGRMTAWVPPPDDEEEPEEP
jgi:hypothetical protein